MTTYYLKTFDDIIRNVRQTARIQSSDTEQINRIKDDINLTYLHKVIPAWDWDWLRKRIALRLDVVHKVGTASVTQNSAQVTLSTAVAPSKKGYWFKVVGYDEIYRIEEHTSGSTTLTLEKPYTGTSNSTASFLIWTDELPLPVDCIEVLSVQHNFQVTPLEAKGYRDFLEIRLRSPAASARPIYYTLSDPVEYSPYESVTGLGAVNYRESSGLIKKLYFNDSNLNNYFSEGDRIRVFGAGHYSYEGEFVVRKVDQTNKYIEYVGQIPYEESKTAESSATVKKLTTKALSETYRKLLVYPAVVDAATTLDVVYKYMPPPLSAGTDEPVIPLEHRDVLVYGALALLYTRLQDAIQAEVYERRFQEKLKKMQTHMSATVETLKLTVDPLYLKRKRASVTKNIFRTPSRFDTTGGSVSAQPTIKSTPSRVAIFDATGVLIADTLIDLDELHYLDGVNANIQTQFINTWTKAPYFFVDETGSARFSWDGSALSITDSSGSPQATDTPVRLVLPFYSANIKFSRQDGQASTSTISIGDGQVLWVQLPDPVTDITYSGVGTSASNFRVDNLGSITQSHTTLVIAYRKGNDLYLYGYGRLQSGESINVSESTPRELLSNLGLTDEITAPSYQSTISGSLNDADYSGTAGESLVNRIGKVTALHKDRQQDLNTRFVVDSITWDGTNLSASGMKILISGLTNPSGADYLTVNDISSTALADGECFYVTINRTDASTALTATKTAIDSVPISERNMVLFWRSGNDVFVRDN